MNLRAAIARTRRRLSVAGGDLPTRAKHWGLAGCPHFIESPVIFSWTWLIFLLAGAQRRAALANMRVIFPDCGALRLRWKVFRLFWNFALTESDSGHAVAGSAQLNWELAGRSHFQRIVDSPRGAILLTAHFSNYDVASHLFARQLGRKLHTVRAPERTPEMQRLMQEQLARVFGDAEVRVHLNTPGSMLGIDLLRALDAGEVVAIQGDRAEGAEGHVESELFGRRCRLPRGPFALAQAARCPIYPIFIVRSGIRRYSAHCQPPITAAATASARRDDAQFDELIAAWRNVLERAIAEFWPQWYCFQPMWDEPAESA